MLHRITSYKELKRWSEAFSKGAFSLLFVVGHMGQGKSRHLTDLIFRSPPKDKKPKKTERPHAEHIAEPLWVEGGAVSAFKLYQQLWYHQHETIVLDDVDSVYTDRQLVRLLKALCQTEREKTIGWHTENPTLVDRGIPTKFKTRSRVCIIANRWKTLNEHVGSLLDRGMMVQFEPPPREVLEFAKSIKFAPIPDSENYRPIDKDIIKFVDQHLWMVDELSLRTLRGAMEAKYAGLDWKAAVAESLGIRDLILCSELEKGRYHSSEERVMEFQRQTGQSRPMYFKAAARLAELRIARDLPAKSRKRKGT